MDIFLVLITNINGLDILCFLVKNQGTKNKLPSNVILKAKKCNTPSGGSYFTWKKKMV